MYACVVKAPAPNFGLIAGVPENTVSVIIHIDVGTFSAACGPTIFPNDLTWTQKDEIRNLVLPFSKVLGLTLPLKSL